MIDIDAERVAKEAGEVVLIEVRPRSEGFSWFVPRQDLVAGYRNRPEEYETRALVVQNPASNPLSPGEYFRCDECHEPAGTRQVCRSCVRLEIERDDVVEAQNSAVKVPDAVMESAKFLAQWFPGGGLYRDHASAILSFLQSLTHPTETPQ